MKFVNSPQCFVSRKGTRNTILKTSWFTKIENTKARISGFYSPAYTFIKYIVSSLMAFCIQCKICYLLFKKKRLIWFWTLKNLNEFYSAYLTLLFIKDHKIDCKIIILVSSSFWFYQNYFHWEYKRGQCLHSLDMLNILLTRGLQCCPWQVTLYANFKINEIINTFWSKSLS